ncbi:MAG: hypothetical protein GXP42_09090 [Chloroflexi bacterium]|nr:hypothetical protein [Chloroflexota bacterium]
MAQALTLPQPRSRPSAWPLVFIWLLAPVLLAILAVAQFELNYVDRIYPGVQALGVDLSGMTQEEALIALEEAAAEYDLPPLALRHGDQVWPLTGEELGVEVDVEQLVAQAFAVGRTGDPWQNLATQWETFRRGERITPLLRVQPGAVTQVIETRTASLNRPVILPRLALSDLQVVMTESRPGQVVDVEATKIAVMERLESGRGGVVDVVVRELPVSETDLETKLASIQALLEQPIVLADPSGDYQFALDPATLYSLLETQEDPSAAAGVRFEIREDALRPIVEGWAEQVARPPLDARFDFDPNTNTLIELSPGVEGYALDVDATIAAIAEAIRNGEHRITLPVKVIQPAVPSNNPQALGIKELISEGTTKFKGSSAARVKNIEVAASKFVGVVIPPGEVFSFNKYVGDITAANGFEDSLIISGNTTAVGVGGGVCQVSTTVFRAAWFGGFPLVERWAHGYVVSWYGKPGLDATIFTPTVDFKFRNTTENYLLIKPIVDKKKGILTFQFYGTKPDWTVETEAPVYSNRVAPPPPLYIEDPELPAGKVVQFDWAVEGLNAVAKRRVIAADGTVLVNDVLKSRYRPWQAKYRFGPGFQPPAGAEVKWAKR